MLGLKLPTDPRWVNLVQQNIGSILSDHAYCEQKAASNAITLMVKYPEYTELVREMTKIAQEEIEHFGMVHEKIVERNLTFEKEEKDAYVHDLFKFIKRGGSRKEVLVDRLLIGAMIEARSCERFKLLSEQIDDEDLRVFYKELMISEANHYKTFLNFAKEIGGKEPVTKRWKEFLEYEAGVIANYGKEETMHG